MTDDTASAPDPDAEDPGPASGAAQDNIARLREKLTTNTARALRLWAMRWVIGLGGAVIIVIVTGDHYWLPLAALGVAGISLAMIGFNAWSLKRLIAKKEAAKARGS